MHGHFTLEIRQRESGPAVSSVGGSQQAEQSLILVNRKKLTVAQRPTLGGELKREDRNLSEECFAHFMRSFLISSGENALQSNAKVQRQEGLYVVVGPSASGVLDGVRSHGPGSQGGATFLVAARIL